MKILQGVKLSSFLATPDPPVGFKIDRETKEVVIQWGGYSYPLALDRITSPLHLLQWIAHLGEKEWEEMTPWRIRRFIECVCNEKQWNLWHPSVGLTERGTSDTDERSKLTPQLRWKVLKRDGFRCRACGNGPESGAFLQIDHITAISKGGSTVLENLQALCAPCNFGKGNA